LSCLKTQLHIREGREGQIGIHQLLLLVGRQVDLQVLAGPDETILCKAPEIAMASHEAAHQAVLKLLEAPSLRKLRSLAREKLLA
jgi:hypothetical protein